MIQIRVLYKKSYLNTYSFYIDYEQATKEIYEKIHKDRFDPKKFIIIKTENEQDHLVSLGGIKRDEIFAALTEAGFL